MVQDLMAGIDIGGTKIAVAIARKGEKILARTSFRTDADVSPDAAVTQALETLEALAVTHNGRLAAIGIGCPGPLDLEHGRVLSPPNMPRSWYQFALRSTVERQSSLPVIVEND